MARKIPVEDRLIDAALSLAAERGWRQVSFAEILEAAGVPLREAHPSLGSKGAILSALMTRVDRTVLTETEPDPDGSPRDRLFDLLMRRFDALGPHREGLAAIIRDLPRDPATSLCLARALGRSMGWMLQAAGLPDHGLVGMARRKALAGAYLFAMRAWINDASPDLAPTMAALDRALRTVSGFGGLFRETRRSAAAAADPAA